MVNLKKVSQHRNLCLPWVSNELTFLYILVQNRPQGCKGCQKNWKDLRITTMIRFASSFKPKLKKIWKTFIINQKTSKNNIFWLKTSSKTDHGWRLWSVGLFDSFDTPGTPGSGDIWVLRFVWLILWCWWPLADFFHFPKILSYVTFIKLTIEKGIF